MTPPPPFFLSEAVMAQASRLEWENIQSEAKLCSQVFFTVIPCLVETCRIVSATASQLGNMPVAKGYAEVLVLGYTENSF